MTGLVVTQQRGLALPGGFKPIEVKPPLLDEAAERQKAFEMIGDYLGEIDLAYNDILVLKYIPEKLGSLLTGKATQNEQRWQNKCGLVLKYGPTAQPDGFKYEVGDWVFYRPSDGSEIGLKCKNSPQIAYCLILSPAHVIGKVTNPDLLW